MNAQTRDSRLNKIARRIALYIDDEASGTEQDWQEVIAEALNVIDSRSCRGWMRLARVNEMIEVTERGQRIFWKRGRNFEKYLSQAYEGPVDDPR